MRTNKKESLIESILNRRLSEKAANWSYDWLDDLYKDVKLYNFPLINTSKFMLSFKYCMSNPSCLARPYDESVIWLCGWGPIKEGHHPPTFSGHRYYGRGDIIILVCHVIFQDHLIKVPCDSLGRSSSQ